MIFGIETDPAETRSWCAWLRLGFGKVLYVWPEDIVISGITTRTLRAMIR